MLWDLYDDVVAWEVPLFKHFPMMALKLPWSQILTHPSHQRCPAQTAWKEKKIGLSKYQGGESDKKLQQQEKWKNTRDKQTLAWVEDMQEGWGPPSPPLRSIQSRWTQAGTLIGDEMEFNPWTCNENDAKYG